MVARKSKKTRKFRGDSSHGWGERKKHRGAGHRGGKGFAGIGKRGGQKKTKYLSKGIKPVGKHGMSKVREKPAIKVVNFNILNQKLDSWVNNGLIRKEKNVYVINLDALGYDKLLSAGNMNEKLDVTAKYFSKAAKEKITAAGGKVTELIKKRVKETKVELESKEKSERAKEESSEEVEK